MLNKRALPRKAKKNRSSRECCEYSLSFGIKTEKNHSSALAKLSKSNESKGGRQREGRQN